MKAIIKAVIFLLLIVILVGTLYLRLNQSRLDPIAVPAETATPSPNETEVVPSMVPNAEPIPAPTPEPTPTPTPEPTPELFTISVIGDETLTTHQNLSDESEYSYAGRMNGDYSYPFSNTVQYFENDEFTITNLECTLAEFRHRLQKW